MAQKKQKYDRQLRIWGEHGQLALEGANVCLLNCSATGAEALKNLVLGGIGSFTVVDGTAVEPRDVGNNYLVDYDSLGQPKAKIVSSLLQELNDTVDARFVEESPEALLGSNPGFLKDFTLVVATQLREATLLKLDSVCREFSVQLVVAQVCGLAGLLRISVEEHCIVESKRENAGDDLRLQAPWPELKAYAAEFDLDVKDALTHKHIPYAVILLKVAEEWKEAHEGKLPGTPKEQKDFKACVAAHRLGLEEEDNYREALAAAYKVWAPPAVPSEVQAVLDDSAAANLTAASTNFWVMVAALRGFVSESGGQFPLNGSIPDMTSFTESYVELQRVYLDKAAADAAAVGALVRAILKQIGRDAQSIPPADIRHFCKNSRNLRVLRYPSLPDEFSSGGGAKPELQRQLTSEQSTHASLYVLLRAIHHFEAACNRCPGVFTSEFEEDTARLKVLAQAVLSEAGAGNVPIRDDLVSEMCRFGASELHCVAAVMGGMASQEAIKLITRQFVPLAGVLIYNAMHSTMEELKF